MTPDEVERLREDELVWKVRAERFGGGCWVFAYNPRLNSVARGFVSLLALDDVCGEDALFSLMDLVADRASSLVVGAWAAGHV